MDSRLELERCFYTLWFDVDAKTLPLPLCPAQSQTPSSVSLGGLETRAATVVVCKRRPVSASWAVFVAVVRRAAPLDELKRGCPVHRFNSGVRCTGGPPGDVSKQNNATHALTVCNCYTPHIFRNSQIGQLHSPMHKPGRRNRTTPAAKVATPQPLSPHAP